jgi:hypothetical protein
MSEAFAPVMAAIVTFPVFAGQLIRREHHTYTPVSVDVMGITESSISFARPGLADSHSCCVTHGRTLPNSCTWVRNQQTTGVSGYALHHGRPYV